MLCTKPEKELVIGTRRVIIPSNYIRQIEIINNIQTKNFKYALNRVTKKSKSTDKIVTRLTTAFYTLLPDKRHRHLNFYFEDVIL